VFTSPLERCLSLASRLAQRDQCELVSDPDLRELNFGAWEGLSWDLIPRTNCDHWVQDTWNRAPPGGETEHALYLRVQRSHQTILAVVARLAMSGRHLQRIAIVAHGGSLRLLRCLLLQLPLEERWDWRIEPGAVHALAANQAWREQALARNIDVAQHSRHPPTPR
jgi:alpha-ribazole phosphatase